MFSDQFIQVATYLDSDKVIGFGEHEHHSYLHDMNWRTWGMWTRDHVVTTVSVKCIKKGSKKSSLLQLPPLRTTIITSSSSSSSSDCYNKNVIGVLLSTMLY